MLPPSSSAVTPPSWPLTLRELRWLASNVFQMKAPWNQVLSTTSSTGKCISYMPWIMQDIQAIISVVEPKV